MFPHDNSEEDFETRRMENIKDGFLYAFVKRNKNKVKSVPVIALR